MTEEIGVSFDRPLTYPNIYIELCGGEVCLKKIIGRSLVLAKRFGKHNCLFEPERSSPW